MLSWLQVIYSMIAGVALTIGVVHLNIWGGHSRHRVYLFSAGMALAASAGALCELALSQASDLATVAGLLRWANLTVAVTLLCMVWFVRMFLSAGRSWLLWTITGLWTLGLVINFNSAGSLTFSEIQTLRPLETFWGETYFQVLGTTNPWKFMADLASFLIMIFVVDASRTAWRRGDRRSAMMIGGSITFFIVVAGIHTPLVDAGLIKTPTIISAAFVAILGAMSHGLARNVSRSQFLMDEVRVGAERWVSLIEAVHLAVLDVDPEGRIRYANPFFLNLGAWPMGEVVGCHINEFLETPLPDHIFRDLNRAPDSKDLRDVRIAIRSHTGDTRQLALNALRLDNAGGQFSGALFLAEDITEELATNQKLISTRHKLDRIMRSNLLGEFASSLAHELNQPLAIILANAQVARRYLNQEPPKVGKTLDALDDIVQADRRAAGLIVQLRALVHQDVVKSESVDLIHIMEETLALIDREVSNHEITVVRQYFPDPITIEANGVEIQQVLLNLMLNAIQAMDEIPALERFLSVSIVREGVAVQVDIRDSGPGLSSERLATIFTAFNTDRNGNLGLGLTICRRIVEAHGGLISADNNRGAGAIFTFSLPLQPTED